MYHKVISDSVCSRSRHLPLVERWQSLWLDTACRYNILATQALRLKEKKLVGMSSFKTAFFVSYI